MTLLNKGQSIELFFVVWTNLNVKSVDLANTHQKFNRNFF